MDWVETFYAKQQEWAGVYSEPVQPHHREKAALANAPDGRPLRILELGCGGGQVASAIADLGHTIVAVDLNPEAVEHAQRLASERSDGRMTAIRGDFYAIELDGRFDVVCYLDGFGIGDDGDQCRLLLRIGGWLAPEGRALIEIYTPWYWPEVAGRVMEWEDVSRRYGYDHERNRMLDTWWPTADPSAAVTQSLACYAPEDLRRLAASAGMILTYVHPGGAYDHETGVYREQVPLHEAMQYLATLEAI